MKLFFLLTISLLITSCNISDNNNEDKRQVKNNTIESAAIVNLGDTVTAELYPSSKTLYYRIIPDGGALLNLKTINLPRDFIPSFQLFDISRQLIDTYCFRENTPFTYYVPLSNDTFFLSITDRSNNYNEGSFKICFKKDLYDTLEYNNSMKQAYPINFDSVYSATICPNDDVDYYQFTLLDSSNISIIPNLKYLGYNVEFYLMNDDCDFIFNDNIPTTSDTLKFSNLPPKHYFIYTTGHDFMSVEEQTKQYSIKVIIN